MTTPFPNIPAISTKATPAEIKRAFDALRTYYAQLQTVRASVASSSAGGSGSGSADGGDTVPDGGTTGTVDMSIPPVIAGFTATGAFNSIILEWDAPNYSNHAYTEIHRAETDNLGLAVFIGTTPAAVYADTPPDSSLAVTYYYWARNVSTSSVKGPFQATHGAQASTADDPAYLIEVLSEQITSGMLYPALSDRIDLIDMPGTGLVDTVGSHTGSIFSLTSSVNERARVFSLNEAPWANLFPSPDAPAVGAMTKVVSGTVLTPDKQPATLYVPTTAATTHSLSALDTTLNPPIAAGETKTVQLSVYVKEGTGEYRPYFVLTARDAANAIVSYGPYFTYNLVTAAVTITTPANGWSAPSSQIIDVGGGWFKLIFTATYTQQGAATKLRSQIQTKNSAGANSYAGDGVTGIYLDSPAFFVGTVSDTIGDLWYDKDDNNRVYRWTGSVWSEVTDPRTSVNSTALLGITAQLDDPDGLGGYAAAMLAMTASVNARAKVFAQDAVPTAAAAGDLWIETDRDNKLWRWSGTAWESAQDTSKNRTFFQATSPTATAIGDLWFDSDDNNRSYRWTGSGWSETTDPRISANSTAILGIESWLEGTPITPGGYAAAMLTMETSVNARATVFAQNTAPTALAAGDLWVEIDAGNKLWRWNGTAWTSAQDANKNRTFYQATSPTATATGDLWIDSDDNNRVYRWTGSAWTEVTDPRTSAHATALLGIESWLEGTPVTQGGYASAMNTMTTSVTTVQASAATDDAVAYGFNPTFSLWSGTFPDGWLEWSGGSSAISKETVIKRVGQYSVKFTVPAGVNRGMSKRATFNTAPLPVDTILSGTVDVYLEDYVGPGKPGILVRLYYDAIGSYRDTYVIVPITTEGVWQRLPFTARLNPGEQIHEIMIYVMPSWAVFEGFCEGVVIYDNLRFSLFDGSMDALMQAGAVAADLAALDTTVGNQALDIAALDGAITQEETDRINAVNTEQQARIDAINARIQAEAQLDGRIDTEEQARIDLGTALTTAYQNYADTVRQALIDNEITAAEQAAIDEAQIRVDTAKQALFNASFATHLDWRFRNTASGWLVAPAGSLTPQANTLLVTNVTGAAYIYSGGTIAVVGAQQTKARARIRLVAGTGAWRGRLYWQTAGHGYTASFYHSTPNVNNLTDWHIVEWNLTNPTIGATDWVDNIITGIRLDLATAAIGEIWEVDWVAIGEHGFNSVSETAIADMLAITTASAESVSQLQARLDTGDYAAVKTESSASANSIGEIEAKYSVKVDVNGYVAGYGLIATENDGVPTSEFGVLADKFWVCSPGVPEVMPFVIFNGITYMDTAMIRDATITNAKIADLSADKINAGYLAAERVNAGTIAATHLASNAVTAVKISANAVTAAKIAVNAVTATKIAAGSITTAHITAGNITTETINGGAITDAYVAWLPAAIYGQPNLLEFTLATTTLTTIGNSVIIQMDTDWFTGGAYGNTYLKIYRDGILLKTRDQLNAFELPVFIADTPPAGAHVYTLTMWGAVYSYITNTVFAVISTKR